MKPMYTEALFALLMGLVLPGILLGTAVAIRQGWEHPPENLPAEQTQATQAAPSMTVELRQGDGALIQMELEEYLVGVVCGEMPASFEPEALKAQAVAARTYAVKAATTGGKHGDGSLCTESGCCQAYIGGEEYLRQGKRQQDLDKIRAAVYATAGYVLTYQGELIEATYFSCSGGLTEDAAAVWGEEYPYLKATDSPGEENAAYYTDQVYIPKEKLCEQLEISLSGDPAGWFGFTTYTPGGGVNTMVVGGREFRGTELRAALGLRSTAFTVTADAGGAIFTTRGYGHRVGMSQYGADAMAALGADFREILAHYYFGAALTQWREN